MGELARLIVPAMNSLLLSGLSIQLDSFWLPGRIKRHCFTFGDYLVELNIIVFCGHHSLVGLLIAFLTWKFAVTETNKWGKCRKHTTVGCLAPFDMSTT